MQDLLLFKQVIYSLGSKHTRSKAIHAFSVVGSLCPPDPLPPASTPERLFCEGALTALSALGLLVGFALARDRRTGEEWSQGLCLNPSTFSAGLWVGSLWLLLYLQLARSLSLWILVSIIPPVPWGPGMVMTFPL